MVTTYCKKCKGHIGSNACYCEGGPYQFRWSDGTVRQNIEPMFNDWNPVWCVKVLFWLVFGLVLLKMLL